MLYGMPRVGDEDRRPSRLGQRWDDEIEVYKAAVLWMAMHEHIPNTGKKVEDIFVGKSLVVMLDGDKAEILDATMRDLHGQPFDESNQFQMMVGMRSYQHHLDPRAAVSTTLGDMLERAGMPSLLPDEAADEVVTPMTSIYVPRIPIDSNEAAAMMKMLIIFVDHTDPNAAADPKSATHIYAGYTDDELRQGKPVVVIARDGGRK